MNLVSAVVRSNDLAVLTPYLIPEVLRGRKIVNLGDGFIWRAIERLIGPFASQKIFSPRIAPQGTALAILESSPAVILAGANQLNNRYTVWPGLNAERIRKGHLRLIPFGIGLHGESGHADVFSDATKEVLLALHEQIEFSSWRCPQTIKLLRRELPQLSAQLLMTGCPVLYDKPLLEGTPFSNATRRIAVTVTERHDFWKRETELIDFVARKFPRAERYLVLHQNYSPPKPLEYLRHRWLTPRNPPANSYEHLRWYAVQRGFRVVCPADADKCIAFYEEIDLHIGSRLHAHLLCLSRAKRSALVAVDGRAVGMADFFGFPLYAADQIERALDFDFEIVRARALAGFTEMQHFLESLPR